MKSHIVCTFYKFTPLNDYEAMKPPLLKKMAELKIKGTIILALEGINGTFAGEPEEALALSNYLKSYVGLTDLIFKQSFDDCNPFEKAKVKLRKEIVTLGAADIDPMQSTGIHVEPKAWNSLIADPEVLVIDTRNDYEVKLGTFKNAINPQTDNFRDFPQYVAKHLTPYKDKKIAMFCTGGIRCEKSTAYLKSLGFKDVYQLDGGILNYLASTPASDSLWEGNCFVFDERVALDPNLNSLEKGSIDSEWKNNHKNHS